MSGCDEFSVIGINRNLNGFHGYQPKDKCGHLVNREMRVSTYEEDRCVKDAKQLPLFVLEDKADYDLCDNEGDGYY